MSDVTVSDLADVIGISTSRHNILHTMVDLARQLVTDLSGNHCQFDQVELAWLAVTNLEICRQKKRV